MQNILITGSNRGIGLAMVQQCLNRDNLTVFASCRQPAQSDDLQELATKHPGRVVVVPLDVTDSQSIEAAVNEVEKHTDALDVLLNNAGVNPPRERQRLETVDVETMQFILHVNSIAPLMVARAFMPLLRTGENPRIVNVTSGMGSLSSTNAGGYYGYRTSKAALNMVTRVMAADLNGEGIVTICVDPGWVKTDMGGQNARITPEESASGLLALVEGLSGRDAGKFFVYNGETRDW
jgi:NAD(P)-dependent dehydrogenase (short-subunit alcohol dehydrogenase family)